MIDIQGLQKVLDGDQTLSVDALHVSAGEVVAVQGARGLARHALLALLLGREQPTAGLVRVVGIDPYDQHQALSPLVGVLFEEDCLYERLTVLGNLAFFCRLYRLPRSRAAEALETVGLVDQARRRVAGLPQGLARRLALARAILHGPRVLLLEEPFVRCDEASVEAVSRVIKGQAEGGVAVLALSEAPPPGALPASRAYTLTQGRLVPLEEEAAPQPRLPFKVPARGEDKIVLVNPADILYAATREGRTYLQTVDALLPTQFTLAELEERLGRSGFFRAHRGYLVNLQHIREVIPYTRDSFTLRLDDPARTEVPLSKSAAADLRALLGY